MPAVASPLPLTETQAPEDQAALAAALAAAHAQGTAVYPFGGGTSLDFGLPATTPGIGLTTTKLSRIVDYPVRDMTVSVEAGITLDALARALAAERQWLPVEGAQPQAATLGGLMATAFSGPRRYGYGTLRDYVIGMTAVDVRGVAFKAGGRVVKNVAGYDFCKLLTGSFGTLGIISQVTLKVRPIPERSAFLFCELHDLDAAERLLAAIVDSGTTPVAVELLLGPHWREHPNLGTLTAGAIGRLAVGLEGTAGEVEWMLARLAAEWNALGATEPHVVSPDASSELWQSLQEFSALTNSPLVLKASVLPSKTTAYIKLVQELDPQASIQAHAGNGIVIARFARFDAGDVSRGLIARLHPAAQSFGGNAIVLSSTLEGWTRQALWGNASPATPWMGKIKRQFDPQNLLNPGRFAYDMS